MTPPIPATPPHFSVNRVRLVDLPGLAMDEEVRGRLAYHLLSMLAMIEYARAQAAALGLPQEYLEDSPTTRRGLPQFLETCLSHPSPDTAESRAARAVGLRLGRNLGHILLVLHRGDAVNRAARPDWGPEDWARWAAVRQVWLGGGLVSGRLGQLILEGARGYLTETGYEGQPRVAVSPHCGEMALLGAARYLPPQTRCAICLDLGHTAVKRACLQFSDDRLFETQWYPSLAVQGNWHLAPDPDRTRAGQEVLSFVADSVARSFGEARTGGLVPGEEVMLCVAAYVNGGHLLGNGLYATMSELADDVRPLLATAIGQRLREAGDAGERQVRVHLIHDGTAAAATHAGERGAAVIVVGTALGVGFPPADAHGLLRLD